MWKVRLKIFFHECWKKYMVVVVVIVSQCMTTYNLMKQSTILLKSDMKIHLIDYIVCFFKGTTPYTLTGGSEAFNIPPYWSLYFLYYFLIVSHMTGQFSKKFKQQLLLREKTRISWWLEINFEIWLECVGYFIVTAVTFVGFAISTGATFSRNTSILIQDILGTGFISENIAGMIVVFFISLLSFTYIQCVMSMVANTIIGIVISIATLVISVFHNHLFLIGNYLMLMRQEMFITSGFGIVAQVGVNLGIILIMVFLGYQHIKRKDLF